MRPTLKNGAKGDDVKVLQDLLNRIGALLDTDGVFGDTTETRVKEAQSIAKLPATGIADDGTWASLDAQPLPSPILSTRLVTFICVEEVGGREYYERVSIHPEYPGGASGITIGVGYDLAFQKNFDAEWGTELSSDQMERLRPFLGKQGTKEAVKQLSDISIPFFASWRVFLKKTLPDEIQNTRGAFDTFDTLPDQCKGVLVSLIYNRGASMDATKDSRKEMVAIRDHLKAGKTDLVEGEIRAMKRLWDKDSGLIGRREREALLWHEGVAG